MFSALRKIDLRPVAVSAALVFAGELATQRPMAGTGEAAVAQHLEGADGLHCDPDSVQWGPREDSWRPGQSKQVAMLLCRAAVGAPRDVFTVHATRSRDGGLLGIGPPHNVSDTSLSDERSLRIDGPFVGWLAGDARHTYRLELADLRGEDSRASQRWPWLSRAQHAVTHWQHTGSLRGLGRRSFKLDPAGEHVQLELRGAVAELTSDGDVTEVALREQAHQSRFLLELPRQIALPGNFVTWAVDRARDVPFIGNEPIQWLKAVVFQAREALDFSNSDEGTGEGELVLGSARAGSAEARPANDTTLGAAPAPTETPDARWPPERLETVVFPPLPEEGQWRSLQSDPYVGGNPGLPPPFTTTFLRPDPSYRRARVVFVVWDPRRVDLEFMPGTHEPRSPSGEVGSGFIPREDDSIERLLGAFNGGFQTTHGGWGAVAERQTFVPPLPFAATVVRYADGATGFGTWPRESELPDDVWSARQNLSPLVAEGRFNPYGRVWWGGVPIGWKDDAKTVRSGLCQRSDGLVAYLYGSRIDHRQLAEAMLIAECTFGMHLDMNPGHTGFEYYSVSHRPQSLSESELDPHWKAERAVPGRRDLNFRARKLFPSMQLMNFPRYIRRQRRDFFFLTERRLLPGARLEGAFPSEWEEGRWDVHGLPQHGYPYALASTWLRPDAARPETKVRVLKLDLKWLAATRAATPPRKLAVRVPQPLDSAGAAPARTRTLWLGTHRAEITDRPPPSSRWIPIAHEETGASAAWGLAGEDLLLYAEVVTARSPGTDAEMLERLLTAAGATRVLPTTPTQLAIAGTSDLAGHPLSAPPGPSVYLYRKDWQAQRPLFPETPIVPWHVWKPLQP